MKASLEKVYEFVKAGVNGEFDHDGPDFHSNPGRPDYREMIGKKFCTDRLI